jgi:hypothetical protein
VHLGYAFSGCLAKPAYHFGNGVDQTVEAKGADDRGAQSAQERLDDAPDQPVL